MKNEQLAEVFSIDLPDNMFYGLLTIPSDWTTVAGLYWKPAAFVQRILFNVPGFTNEVFKGTASCKTDKINIVLFLIIA